MKIFYVLSNFPKTTEVFIHREIRELIKLKHNINVISLSPFNNKEALNKESHYPNNVELIKPSSNPLNYLLSTVWSLATGKSMFLKITHWKFIFFLIGKKNIFKILYMGMAIDNLNYRLRNETIAIEHVHSHDLFLSSYVAFKIANSNKIPFSLTLHATTFYYSESLLTEILKKATFLRTISTELEHYFNRWISNDTKFHYITNGVYSEEFIFNPTPYSQNTSLILGVGSLLDKKGFDLLIEACLLLKENDFPFKCEIYGEGPERQFLETIINNLKLKDEIKLMGHKPINEIIKRMHQAQTLVMPSREPKRSTRDGLPTVIIEAMASKLPVIASSYAGIPDIVKHKETGLIISMNDYKAIANSIIQIAYDNNLREKIIEGGYSLVKNNYSLSQSVTKLISLFELEKNHKN